MAIAMFSLVGVIPSSRSRKYVNDILFRVGFRLLCRPLSTVVTFHNLQYRPRNQGVCVANHTSPYDICILGVDCTYSLVRFTIEISIGIKHRHRRHFVHFMGRIYWRLCVCSFVCLCVCFLFINYFLSLILCVFEFKGICKNFWGKWLKSSCDSIYFYFGKEN